jgi:hypothetical protein
MGVVGALLTLVQWNKYIDLAMPDRNDTQAQVVSLVLFVALCLFMYFESRRAKA